MIKLFSNPKNCFLTLILLGIADLQRCVGFRYSARWYSYTYTYIHHFLDSSLI